MPVFKEVEKPFEGGRLHRLLWEVNFENFKKKKSKPMKRHLCFIITLLCSLVLVSCQSTRKQTRILYFTTEQDKEEFLKLKSVVAERGWTLVSGGNLAALSDDSLSQISAVVMRVSEINKLTFREIPQLKRYLEAGGGGIVAIRDTVFIGTGWPWLKEWLNAEDLGMPKNVPERVSVLNSKYKQSDLLSLLTYAIGENQRPDFKKALTLPVPDSSRYVEEILIEGLDEPMQMALLPNLDVLLVERKGGVKLYDNASGEVKYIAHLNTFSGIEDGLLGVVLDPDFEKNNWVYFYYAIPGEASVSRLSRFELYGDSLALESEKKVLEVPTQRVYCCHSAGYLAFDQKGLLYLSTGDNTNAEETFGYTPVDERPGRELSDVQASAANTQDLRGKILRIKPLASGGYQIPEGNLFPKDGTKGRPEIYIMGARNPFRYSIDSKNNFLYWGDVGPDTKARATNGELMSFDEINQAREAGFFGWPYFLGNNEVFPKYDYATQALEPGKDPLKPLNLSPHNTGAKELPPAQPAMIWYGKGNSKEFPLVGSGGASAMAGPVFYRDNFKGSPYKLPTYYDGKLFIFEWIRGWVMAVTLDNEGNFQRMEPFLDHLTFDAPVDMQFAKDGSIYMLEYGTNWFAKNTDAKLKRVRYVEGNRMPVAVIDLDKKYGAAPFTVHFSGKRSVDFDEGPLSYSWELDNKRVTGEVLEYTFNKAGTYEAVLTVTNPKGGVGKTSAQVFVGNTPPDVRIETQANKSFYWDNSIFDYKVLVKDKEEEVDSNRVNISFGFIPFGKDAATVLSGNQNLSNIKYLKGKQLISTLDCKSCHSLDQKSVGPTYLQIATRYSSLKEVDRSLAKKIIEGGGGVWGERAMTAHPEVSMHEAEQMVAYILSLAAQKGSLPLEDVLTLQEHKGQGLEGAYLLSASYTDQGANGIEPLLSQDYILLKNPTLQAEEFEEGNVGIATHTTAFLAYATNIQNGGYIKFKGIDLTHVTGMVYQVQLNGSGGEIEARLDGRSGPLISTVVIPSGKATTPVQGWREVQGVINPTVGTHDLYFVFKGSGQNSNLFNLDWIRFQNE